jgi:[acyl-carrier-protein] S-malonyltransferase
MKTAFVFAGQGSQYAGMAKDFYEKDENSRKFFDSIHMDFDVKEVCFQDENNHLNDTAYTQSCILASSMAIAQALQGAGIEADAALGLSLGEYSALCYAGVLEKDDALEIVRKRGKIMAEALPAGTSKMVAVLKGDEKIIEQVCQNVSTKEHPVCIANYNSPAQIVLSGDNEGVDAAVAALKEQGVKRFVPLKVSGAFHSPLLNHASLELEEVLRNYHFNTPTVPVFFNVSAKAENENIPSLLKQQICSSVLFYPSLKNAYESGIDTFIEIGPGKSLNRLIKTTLPDAKVYSIDSYEDFLELKASYQGEQA